MRPAVIVALLVFPACMRPGWGGTPPDASPEPDARDAASVRDSGVEVEVRDCDQLLYQGFDCAPFPLRPFAAVCSDEAIEKLIANCYAPYDGETCGAVRKEFPECSRCTSWFVNHPAACMRAVAPDSGCGKTWNCARDCENAVCADCVASYELDGDGGVLESEYDECAKRASAGECSDRAAAATACEGEPRFAPCMVKDNADLPRYLRGACRDGGDWSKTAADAATD